MIKISPEIEAVIATPDFQKIMNTVGPVLLESGERRKLPLSAIQQEISEFALHKAQIILDQG